ncbi:family 2 glycosyl transferase [Nibricoccus aquaticus]|uniref:Family 2 glycosyl transferase n=1 Tax=Nibricoccus aquaticus TaxID=2576891 RepID=A0A290QAM4_9BACT|nr:glycosyltransferase [Nibricoccus aquaticus]ATC63286.1 family 2 glycosyl transferase [Nibricoccus aquaticus]
MISVILCTHNPRADFLARTLDSLRMQDLPVAQWEFVLVDNHSRDPLSARLDLSWHPRARVVREDELGLTPARLRGIAETSGELLVFVDDDNILQPDYLRTAATLAVENPQLGCWGGSCIGEFETPPPSWAAPYLCYLAIRETTRFTWANEYRYDIVPTGAGMCIRRHIAETYARETKASPLRRELDRKGASLVSGGDSDMAFTAIDQGLGIGLSPRLSLRHLMTKGRLELAYLERLMEGIASSAPLVLHVRGAYRPAVTPGRINRWLSAYRLSRQPAPVRRMEAARQRGEQSAAQKIASLSCPA